MNRIRFCKLDFIWNFRQTYRSVHVEYVRKRYHNRLTTCASDLTVVAVAPRAVSSSVVELVHVEAKRPSHTSLSADVMEDFRALFLKGLSVLRHIDEIFGILVPVFLIHIYGL